MRNPETSKLDLAAIRARLEGRRGERFWRSLDEVAGTPEFRDYLEHEFPAQADTWDDPAGRRRFLKIMGASLAFAGLTGCGRQPLEKIVPYVESPEELVPGRPLYYATAFPFRGFGLGILAESNMGRPTKIEGNPQHPASLGATDALAQASVLTLYDPDRAQAVDNAGLIGTWDNFSNAMAQALAEARLRKGEGFRLLTGAVTSPTLAFQIRTFLDRYPLARWHSYEPAGRDAVRAGTRLAFGEELEVRYRFDRADVIVALDADFLASGPSSVRDARDFAARRRVRGEGPLAMNRLYAVECAPGLAGAMADHRLALRASEVEPFARALAAEVGVGPKAPVPAAWEKWIAAVARDLRAHRGTGLVLAGEQQPAVVHALAHALNDGLGNAGRTVTYGLPAEASPADSMGSIRALSEDMEAGRVSTLVILGGNPAYDAPADLAFSDRLARVKLRVHLSLYLDETSELCHWRLPESHYLESWSDCRSLDGTVTIQQPLIAPLYDSKSAHEVLSVLLDRPDGTGHDIVKAFWKTQRPVASGFETFWKESLHDGFVAGTSLPERKVSLAMKELPPPPAPPPAPSGDKVEIIFRPDPAVWDGRFANNGWLQEMPKPLTKLTWDNAAFLAPRTAERLGLTNGDVVVLGSESREVEAPVWILPGQPESSVTLHLGYGRRKAGRVGDGAGFDANALRRSLSPWFDPAGRIRGTGRTQILACTQHHQSMEGRHLVRTATLEEFRARPDFVKEVEEPPSKSDSLYPGFTYDGYAWGMVMDLNACTGCGACVMACQSENNSPVVGKEQVAAGREMHWIRIDRYYEGDLDQPRAYHEPVVCMHCENAPCELVCPVGATVHSQEGLNEMIYNRCIGTRYCSNNCPYKVRRFNFLQYSDVKTPSLKLLFNPNVTVRNRGVMEKCSYCVQRISEARITAEKESRAIKDGEVVTACQAACPSEAIIFGDQNDPGSRVAKVKAQPHNYGLLTELNTRPRTTYLARLRNPNPELEPEQA